MAISNNFIKTALITLFTSSLIACGGGGGGSDDSTTRNTSTTTNTSSNSSNSSSGQTNSQNTSKTVTLSWTAPTTRANGDPLNMSDIAGYEVYYFMDGSPQSDGEAITINNASTTQITTPGLQSGTYFFAIATIDTQNLVSDLSDYVEAAIDWADNNKQCQKTRPAADVD